MSFRIRVRKNWRAMYKTESFRLARENDHFELLLRVVNYSDIASEKVARIHRGLSLDGVNFALGSETRYRAGRETCPVRTTAAAAKIRRSLRSMNPTTSITTGWNERIKRGELLMASGSSLERLEKRGIAFASTASVMNPKEAEIVRAEDGSWRLFFEYAEENRSKIGVASAPRVDGPWTVGEPLFAARPGWDDWHTSTGPIVGDGDMLPRHVLQRCDAGGAMAYRVDRVRTATSRVSSLAANGRSCYQANGVSPKTPISPSQRRRSWMKIASISIIRSRTVT